MTTTPHANCGLTAVWAGIPTPEGKRRLSSGLLLAPRLVLISRHGVVRNGSVLPGVSVSLVTGPHGAVSLSEEIPGNVIWLGSGDLDAALAELPPGVTVPDGFLPVDLCWAEPIASRPVAVTVTGMPRFAAQATGNRVEVETARGRLEPGTYAVSGRKAINVDAWPAKWQDWMGMSGAAVVTASGGYLLGVTAWSDMPLAGRRLTAVPVRALLEDSGFRAVIGYHLGRVPDVEPAELAPLLQSRRQRVRSVGALLRPDAGLTEFTGRSKEIAELRQWRDESASAGPDVKVLLMTGRGGEGKTRLAREFIEGSRQAGWKGGMLRSSASPDQANAVGYVIEPLLLGIDYAAARSDAIATLVRAIIQARPAAKVRLLLLSRTSGAWWADLAADLHDDLPGIEGHVRPLQPLLATTDSHPAAVFTGAAEAFAPHLAPFTGRTEAELRDLAARLEVPDLTGPRFLHVLTVQMTALAALLQAAIPVPQASGGDDVEDVLLQHEARHRNLLARQRGLDYLQHVRDRAVAGAALFGARGPTPPDARQAASSIVAAALAPELNHQPSRQRAVATWIGDIYPPEEPGPSSPAEYWGPVLPDRLGEFLVVRLLAEEQTTTGVGGLLEAVTGESDEAGIARGLLTLSRATEHDQRAADWIECVVTARPMLAAEAALRVASYAENPTPLRAALVQLGLRAPALLRRSIYSVVDTVPRFSVQELESSTGITREIAAVFRELAARDGSTWSVSLAGSLNDLSVRLSDSGRTSEALTASQEAVALARDLLSRDPEQLPNLAIYLLNQASRLADNGQPQQALQASSEALAMIRGITGLERDRALPRLAMALNNHATLLNDAGAPAEALRVSEEAVTARRQLAEQDPKAHLPDLAMALHNHAALLFKNRRHGDALRFSQQAVAAWRKLAGQSRESYLPQLAKGLSNHANYLLVPEVPSLAGTGTPVTPDALRAMEESVTIWRELATINRDAYLPSLAASLLNLAMALAMSDRSTDVLQATDEALTAFRELVQRNRAAHLPALAKVLCVRTQALGESGRIADSLAAANEAVAICREMVTSSRSAHLHELAESLAMLAAPLFASARTSDGIASCLEARGYLPELPAPARVPASLLITSVMQTEHWNNPAGTEAAYQAITKKPFPSEWRSH